MRVFPVAQILFFSELEAKCLREFRARAVRLGSAQVIGDGAIVARGVFKRLFCQLETDRIAHRAMMVFYFLDNARVVSAIDDNSNRGIIFSRRPQQGWATDVYVFDRLSQRAVI